MQTQLQPMVAAIMVQAALHIHFGGAIQAHTCLVAIVGIEQRQLGLKSKRSIGHRQSHERDRLVLEEIVNIAMKAQLSIITQFILCRVGLSQELPVGRQRCLVEGIALGQCSCHMQHEHHDEQSSFHRRDSFAFIRRQMYKIMLTYENDFRRLTQQ
jgi:hypothetical protein